MTVPDPEGRQMLSFSALSAHRKCPAMWAYRYLDRLTPDSNQASLARDFGSMWHALRAIDSVRRGIATGTLRSRPETITTGDFGPTFEADGDSGVYRNAYGTARTDDELLETLELWYEELAPQQREPWEEEFPDGVIARLTAMNRRWHSRWDADTAHEHVLGVEVEASRNLGGGRWIQGKVDEVYLDTRSSMVVVRDHKSSGTMPTDGVVDDLMDSQLYIYAWIIAPTVLEWGHGEPRALAYDRARTAQAKPPQLTKSGTLSKAVTDYDLAAYLDFTHTPVPYPGLKKDGSGAGVYEREQAVMEKLSTLAAQEVWNRRTRMPVNTNVVLAHLHAAQDTADDQDRTRERVGLGRAPARNIDRRGCKWCDFAGLCRAQMLGGLGAETSYDPAEFGLRRRG